MTFFLYLPLTPTRDHPDPSLWNDANVTQNVRNAAISLRLKISVAYPKGYSPAPSQSPTTRLFFGFQSRQVKKCFLLNS